jgi:predicted nucleic acid-binding protein
VKLIIDANIVFSAILNSKSKIADVLINSKNKYQFIAPEYLRHKIRSHYLKISKLTFQEISELEFQVCREINFISEEQINSKVWKYAYNIGHVIDEKDIIYIAFSKHFKCRSWTGDKKLINGLKKQGLSNFITSNELIQN